jgi:hypothetical protein
MFEASLPTRYIESIGSRKRRPSEERVSVAVNEIGTGGG